MAAAMRYLGYSINDTDEEKWKQARDLIIRAKPYWAAFNAQSYIKELTVGNIWLAHGYSNDFYQAALDAKKAGRKFTINWRIPKEGAVIGMDSMVIHKSAPRPDLAHKFINFMLEGENSAELTNLIGAGNPNVAALPFIKPEIAQNPAIFPDSQTIKHLEFMKDFDRKQRRVLSRMWTEIKLKQGDDDRMFWKALAALLGLLALSVLAHAAYRWSSRTQFTSGGKSKVSTSPQPKQSARW
jgi:spermidine/putrescine transport system substrate-binding protein